MIRFMINAFLFLVGVFLLIAAVILLAALLKGIQHLLEVHVPIQRAFYVKDGKIYRVRTYEREIRSYVTMIKISKASSQTHWMTRDFSQQFMRPKIVWNGRGSSKMHMIRMSVSAVVWRQK